MSDVASKEDVYFALHFFPCSACSRRCISCRRRVVGVALFAARTVPHPGQVAVMAGDFRKTPRKVRLRKILIQDLNQENKEELPKDRLRFWIVASSR